MNLSDGQTGHDTGSLVLSSLSIVMADIELVNLTNSTLEQMNIYKEKYNDFKQLQSISASIREYSFVVSGLVGIISYLLMLISLRHLQVSGCTLVYHKAITVLELFHMLIMTESGFLEANNKTIPKTLPYATWVYKFYCGWTLGDWAKLAVSTLTAFLTLERFVAVCLPAKFDSINRTPVAYFAIVVSIFVGSAHVWYFFTVRIELDEKELKYISVQTWFAQNGFFIFTINFIFVTKIILSLIIFSLCFATAAWLRKEAKKMATMTSSARGEWKVKKRACTFSYVVGLCVLLDHFVWVMYKSIDRQFRPTLITWDEVMSREGGTVDQAINDIWVWTIIEILGLAQVLTGQLVHAWRFFIYLALNRTMRHAFRDAMPCPVGNQVAPLRVNLN